MAQHHHHQHQPRYLQQPLQPPYLPPLPPPPPLPLQPHHHPYPYPYPYPHHQPIYPPAQAQLHLTRPTKRPRDDDSVLAVGDGDDGGRGGDSAAKRRKGGGDVLFRVVVGSREVGKVIGKQGMRIQKVREATKANVKIADALAPYEERVIIITSKSNEDKITDAEKALHQVAELILMDDGKSSEALAVVGGAAIGSTSYVHGIGVNVSLGIPDAVGGVHLVANSIRLLIAGSQATGLVGASGQNIEMLEISSGASITLLPPNQLSYCASAHESDRLVQISGEVSAVLKAVDEIGCQLRQNPAKQVISISPAYNITSTRAVPHYIDPTAADYVTLDMVISETMVGGLIGRSGSNISRIRNESGATIKVHGGKGEQKNRQIQLAGTAEQVALARQRVDEYIFSQLIQQADRQQ